MSNRSLNVLDRINQSVDEILNSEVTYRNGIYKLLVNYKPVINGNKKLSSSPLSTLFDILEDICCLTSDLIISLQQNTQFHDLIRFAECFLLRERQILYLYSDYCSILTNAIDVLSKLSTKEKVMSVFRQIQIEGRHELPLSAELLKPFQHLFAYEMLLDKLYKATLEYKSSNASSFVYSALKRIRFTLEQINELKRMEENRARRKELLNGGVRTFSDFQLDKQGNLLFEGIVNQFNKSIPRHLILLENCLLICKRYFTFLIAKHIINTDRIIVDTSNQLMNDPKMFAVIDAETDQRYEFIASSAEQKRLWIKHLNCSFRLRYQHCNCSMHHPIISSSSNSPAENDMFSSSYSWPPSTNILQLHQTSYQEPKRTRSVLNQRKNALRRYSSNSGSAPQLNDLDNNLIVRTENIFEIPVKKKSMLRVYSFKKKRKNMQLSSLGEAVPKSSSFNNNCLFSYIQAVASA